jgi:hypothetical protein
MPELSEQDMAQVFQELAAEFDTLCQERHAAGAAEYGKFTFMANDVVRMMAEELADTANYCRMQFIKLMFLQLALEQEIATADVQSQNGTVTIGVQSFMGTGDKGWRKA